MLLHWTFGVLSMLAPTTDKTRLKRAGGSADLQISKSALLSLNHHNFSNPEQIYTK